MFPLSLSVAVLAFAPAIATSPAPAVDDPAPLAGAWTWSWKDAEGTTHRHVLDIEVGMGKAKAQERFDQEKAVEVDDLKLRGDVVTFSVKRDARMAEYKGKLKAGRTIAGDVDVAVDGQRRLNPWVAERVDPKRDEPSGPQPKTTRP